MTDQEKLDGMISALIDSLHTKVSVGLKPGNSLPASLPSLSAAIRDLTTARSLITSSRPRRWWAQLRAKKNS